MQIGFLLLRVAIVHSAITVLALLASSSGTACSTLLPPLALLALLCFLPAPPLPMFQHSPAILTPACAVLEAAEAVIQAAKNKSADRENTLVSLTSRNRTNERRPDTQPETKPATHREPCPNHLSQLACDVVSKRLSRQNGPCGDQARAVPKPQVKIQLNMPPEPPRPPWSPPSPAHGALPAQILAV